MGLISKQITFTPTHIQKTIYKEKGYDVNFPITVSVEELTENSSIKLQVQCDFCGMIFLQSCRSYKRGQKYVSLVCCKDCAAKKREIIFLKKYGVHNIAQLSETTEKKKNTWKLHYGTENIQKLPFIQEKRKQTCLAKYGVPFSSSSPLIRQKISQSNRNLSLKQKEIKQYKIKQTMLKKYGVENPMQNFSVFKKAYNTKIKKYGTAVPNAPISTQQKQLWELYGGILNHQIGFYTVDIFFPKEKIYFEYDGGGHMLCVKLGKRSKESFNRYAKIRKSTLLNKGLKEFRIICDNDKLPSITVLLQIKKQAWKKLCNEGYHSYIYNTILKKEICE